MENNYLMNIPSVEDTKAEIYAIKIELSRNVLRIITNETLIAEHLKMIDMLRGSNAIIEFHSSKLKSKLTLLEG